jgi:nucleoside-diphosphate-sugar epimerase
MTSRAESTEYAGVRALVLGASGFIGRWVARALAQRGAEVIHAVREREAFEPVFRTWRLKGETVEANLMEPGAADELVVSVRPSIVFNLAGYGVDRSERDEAVSWRLNADLVVELAQAMAISRDPAWQGLDVVHAGSALEYGTAGGDLAEDSTPQPSTVYGRSKLEGTRALRAAAERYGLRAVTARMFTVYGAGEHSTRLLPCLIEAARSGAAAPLTEGWQKRDFTYVEDVAEGLCRLGRSNARDGEAVNLATGKLSTVRNFAETAAALLRIPPERLEFGKVPIREEEMDHTEVSVVRLRSLVDWAPAATLAEGIEKTLQFYQGQDRGWTLCNGNETVQSQDGTKRPRAMTSSPENT